MVTWLQKGWAVALAAGCVAMTALVTAVDAMTPDLRDTILSSQPLWPVR